MSRGGSWLGMLSGKDVPPLYNNLDQRDVLPGVTPWPWLLAIVFAAYYAICGLAYYLVRIVAPWTGDNVIALVLILVLLVLSALWSWGFVKWRSPILALVLVFASAVTAIIAAVFAFPHSVGGGIVLLVLGIYNALAGVLCIFIQIRLQGIPKYRAVFPNGLWPPADCSKTTLAGTIKGASNSKFVF